VIGGRIALSELSLLWSLFLLLLKHLTRNKPPIKAAITPPTDVITAAIMVACEVDVELLAGVDVEVLAASVVVTCVLSGATKAEFDEEDMPTELPPVPAPVKEFRRVVVPGEFAQVHVFMVKRLE
jgi:hypothetical protein